jgi:hypothetical protein
VLHKHATDAALSARKLLETNGGGLLANNQLREQLIQSDDTSFRTASSLRSAAFFSTLCVTIEQLFVVCCLVSVL